MFPPRLASFRGRPRGRLCGRGNLTPTQGGVSGHDREGCQATPCMSPLSLLGFSSSDRTTRTAPAVRERTGATPRFGRWRGTAQGGVSGPVSGTVSDIPLAVGGVAPVSIYPCRKAPRPAGGPDDEPSRAAPCLTDSSARSWSSASSVSRAPGRGPAHFPKAIPWRSWSATTTPNVYTRRRRVVLRGAWRGGVPRRSVSSQLITDLVCPDGRQSGAPVSSSRVATFAHGGRPGHCRRRGPSPGPSHREPGPRMADDPRAWPLYRRGDFRRRRVRQDLRVYAPVRPPTLRAGTPTIPSGAWRRWSLK